MTTTLRSSVIRRLSSRLSKRGAPKARLGSSAFRPKSPRGWRSAWQGGLALAALELLAGFFGALLQLLLQLLLRGLELFRIGRRTVIGLGEIGERQHQADRLAGPVDALHHQALTFLELADQLEACLVIGHAAVVEADHVRPGHRLALVDDDA